MTYARLTLMAVALAVSASARPATMGSSRAAACPTCYEMTEARATHTATLLPSGDVLLVGGMAPDHSQLATAELFDPRTGQFRKTGSMPGARAGHTATLLRTGKVLIAGGYTPSGVVASALLYDPDRGAFEVTSAMNVARGRQTATLLDDGRVLMVGGENSEEVATATAELYDPRTGRFTPAGTMSVARAYHVAARLPGNRVLVAGGGPDLHHVTATAEVFDATTGRFSRVGDLNVARRKASAAVLADGSVLVAGGGDLRDSRATIASAEIFDPRMLRFTPTSGSMHDGRFKLPDDAVRLPDGRVVIAGAAAGIEIFDPSSRTFQLETAGPRTALYYSTETLLRDGRILITGGYGNSAAAERGAWTISAAIAAPGSARPRGRRSSTSTPTI